MDDPTAQLNYQIADMIADTFGRSIEDFDIELADRIIAKVREGIGALVFTADELQTIANAMVDDEDEYLDEKAEAMYVRVTEEIDRRDEK